MTYVLHELLADGPDVLGQGGREHHDLLLVRGGPEDLLDVAAHVCKEKEGIIHEVSVTVSVGVGKVRP